jgi:tetratricopeptide (TPR) repeat protein
LERQIVFTKDVATLKPSNLRDEVFDLLYSKNKLEEAILHLNRILKAAPENSQALALKAYALNKLANTLRDWKYSQTSLVYADHALALNPDDDIALASKGWALIDLGKAQEAIPTLEKAVKVNPSNEYAWYNLAWAQYLAGKPGAASESIAKALRINPANPIVKRGRDMMQRGELPAHLRKQAAK